ncbi:MAG: hypothetical protein EOP45_04390, partial [Sphingobacteriaceae bacterium]
LIGFSDACTKAYGAVVYIKIVKNGDVSVEILTAKTRVAPLKGMTLPKLELSAAALLAKLMAKVKMAINIPIAKTTYYSDSQVTLAWIKAQPTKWKLFVANRVAEIQKLSNKDDWKYVSTKENSADCASRGLLSINKS